MIDFIKRNKELGYKTKWELAIYFEKENTVPNQIIEYDLGEDFEEFDMDDQFYESLGKFIVLGIYKKLEISLIGQDKDGHNETCQIVKVVYDIND